MQTKTPVPDLRPHKPFQQHHTSHPHMRPFSCICRLAPHAAQKAVTCKSPQNAQPKMPPPPASRPPLAITRAPKLRQTALSLSPISAMGFEGWHLKADTPMLCDRLADPHLAPFVSSCPNRQSGRREATDISKTRHGREADELRCRRLGQARRHRERNARAQGPLPFSSPSPSGGEATSLVDGVFVGSA